MFEYDRVVRKAHFMKEQLTLERLNELASLYLQRYRMENVDYGQKTLQRLAHAILDAQVMINPLTFSWFDRKKEDPEIVGAISTKWNEFTVTTVAELAQFLSAVSAAVNEERQRRLSKFIPDELPNTGAEVYPPIEVD